MKLWTESLSGNIHEAANTINGPTFWVKWEHVVTMNYTGGGYTQVAFEVTDDEHARLVARYHQPPPPVHDEGAFGDTY